MEPVAKINQTKDAAIPPISTLDATDISLRKQLLEECDAMSRHVLSNALKISPDVLYKLDNLKQRIRKNEQISGNTFAFEGDEVKQLTEIHQALSSVVSPAIPRALKLLADENDRRPLLFFLGPVPLIRMMSILSVVFLVAMIATGLSDHVNSELINKGFLDSSKQELFLNQFFLLCCAGLGASFSNLFLASSFVASSTYDPKYDSTYWSRMIMGLMSGLILVEFLPKELLQSSDLLNSFGKPALAMLAGFSASLVHRILNRLVGAVESIFQSRSDNSQYVQNLRRAENNEQEAIGRMLLANQLVEIKEMLEAGKSTAELQEKINHYLKDKLSAM